jgi:hypothetical protein
MDKSVAVLVGLVFIAIGIFGFIPGVTRSEILFGTFHVNLIHNVLHIVTGIIFIFAGVASRAASRLLFQIFGVIYVVLGVWGLVVAPRNILWVISNNRSVAWLHVALALIFLLLGFGTSRESASA